MGNISKQLGGCENPPLFVLAFDGFRFAQRLDCRVGKAQCAHHYRSGTLGGGHAALCPPYRAVASDESEAYRVGTGLAPR